MLHVGFMTNCHWTDKGKLLILILRGPIRSLDMAVQFRSSSSGSDMKHATTIAMRSSPRDPFDEYRVELDVASIVAALTSRGLALFDGYPNRHDLKSVAEALGKIHLHRDSDKEGFTVLEPKNAPSSRKAGFTAKGLFPHTDSSGEERPPDIIVFCCEQRAGFGGESLFVDGREIFLELRRAEASLLSILTRPDAAMFLSDLGYVPKPIIDQDRFGRFAFRFRLDDLSLFSEPLTYKLPDLVDLIRHSTMSLRLRDGEGFILNNGWWLHGRTGFRGYRRAVRLLVDTVDRAGHDVQRAFRRGFVL
jgi:hypothetical protein